MAVMMLWLCCLMSVTGQEGGGHMDLTAIQVGESDSSIIAKAITAMAVDVGVLVGKAQTRTQRAISTSRPKT
jgi:hypothetical protein